MVDKNSRFYRHMRQVHMDFHMPEFPVEAIRNFDARTFVDHLERGRINMVALFSKCHFGNSFYDTKVGHKHAGLAADFLMEAATECRRRGMFTYAYYSLCTDVHAYEEHDNWRAIDRNGAPSGIHGPWARLCLNTPYKEELVLPQLTEIIQDYPVDALWLDIPLCFANDGCFCASCRRKYQAMHGREMDTLSPEDGVTWNYDACIRLIREVKHRIAIMEKDILICSNRSGHLDAPRTFTEANDILCWESQPRHNYLSHSFTSRYVRTLNRPCQVMSVRFYQGWGDLTLKPAAQMTTEFAAMIGNGAAATSGDQVNVDGTLQPAVYDMFDTAFGFVAEREDLLRRAHSVKDVALLAPVPDARRVAPQALAEPMLGAHKLLVESHVQHDILSALDTGAYADYRTILLPGPGDYAPGQVECLRGWVEAGGTLIGCGASLVRDGNMLLEDLFGIEYLEPSVFSVSHFRPRPEVRGETADLVLQCRAQTQKVIARGATVVADSYAPQGESTNLRAFRHAECAPPATQPAPYPFATVHTAGKGKAVYIAGAVFQAYWTYNHHWLRQFVAGLYDYVQPEPLYTVELPATVETNLMQLDDGDLLLNLVDYQVGHQASQTAIPAIETVYPFHQARCRVRMDTVQAVILEPQGDSLDFYTSDGQVEFTIPTFTTMAMVRLRR